MPKISKNKTNHPKKIKVPHAWIAAASGSSINMVRKVKNGSRKSTGVKGQRIEIASVLLEQEGSKLIQEVKRLVQL